MDREVGKLFHKDPDLPDCLLHLDFLCLVNNQADNVAQRFLSASYSNDVDIPLDQHLHLRVVHGGFGGFRDPFYAVQSFVYGESFGGN